MNSRVPTFIPAQQDKQSFENKADVALNEKVSVEQVLDGIPDDELLPYLEKRFAKQLVNIVNVEVEKAREKGISDAQNEIEQILNLKQQELDHTLQSELQKLRLRENELTTLANTLSDLLSNQKVTIAKEDETYFVALLNQVLTNIFAELFVEQNYLEEVIIKTLDRFSGQLVKRVFVNVKDKTLFSDDICNKLHDQNITLEANDKLEPLSFKIEFFQGDIKFNLKRTMIQQQQAFLNAVEQKYETG